MLTKTPSAFVDREVDREDAIGRACLKGPTV
jgi:hypothetical protein